MTSRSVQRGEAAQKGEKMGVTKYPCGHYLSGGLIEHPKDCPWPKCKPVTMEELAYFLDGLPPYLGLKKSWPIIAAAILEKYEVRRRA